MLMLLFIKDCYQYFSIRKSSSFWPHHSILSNENVLTNEYMNNNENNKRTKKDNICTPVH